VDDIHRCPTRFIPNIKGAVAIITGGNLRPLRIWPAIQSIDVAEARRRPITANGLGVALAIRLILKNLALLWRGLCQSWRGQHQRGERESQDTVHVCAPNSSVSVTISAISQRCCSRPCRGYADCAVHPGQVIPSRVQRDHVDVAVDFLE